jgi:hypothetical protein
LNSLKFLNWTIEEIARGYAVTRLPLNVESSNQYITQQAALMLLAADYTGGIALSTLFKDAPVIGFHPQRTDCPGWTLERLKAKGFSVSVIDALDSVTKRPGEQYDDFAKRAAANTIGRKVKLADLTDNCDLSRIPNPTDADYQRVEKYQRAIELIAIGERKNSKWKMDGSVCPTCGGAGRNSERYPGAVCEDCELIVIDKTGTPVKLYNESMSGGLMIVAGTRELKGGIAEGEALYIRGVECRAKEHRFGGVVIQPIYAW